MKYDTYTFLLQLICFPALCVYGHPGDDYAHIQEEYTRNLIRKALTPPLVDCVKR